MLIVMKNILIQTIIIPLIASTLFGQNPPLTGNPYAPRGKSKSPDGVYEWVVRTDPAIRYELIHIGTRTPVATVSSYYPAPDPMNIRYAYSFGAYWNDASSIVALDELNRRRAGHLYFFILTEKKAHEYRPEQFIPIPKTADEARFVVDPGWISSTKIRVRLAMKLPGSDPASKYYLIDFSHPRNPVVEETQ